MEKTNTKIVQYLHLSLAERKKERTEYYIYSNIPVYIKDPLINDQIDIENVLTKLRNLLPSFFFQTFDYVYIGQFDEFLERDINAMYKDGVLYISNVQDNEEDMLDDMIHEISHGLEEAYANDIYADGFLENEFLSKRKSLYFILKAHGHEPSPALCLDEKYSKEFDEFLYREVGYLKLKSVTMGLFTDPYSITSMREYFAQGSVHYYLNDRMKLKKICPVLFEKMEKLNNLGEKDEY